jgi:hypothetical protein
MSEKANTKSIISNDFFKSERRDASQIIKEENDERYSML